MHAITGALLESKEGDERGRSVRCHSHQRSIAWFKVPEDSKKALAGKDTVLRIDTTEFEGLLASLQITAIPVSYRPYCSSGGHPSVQHGQIIKREVTFNTYTADDSVTEIVLMEMRCFFADTREAIVKLSVGHFLEHHVQEVSDEALEQRKCHVTWTVLDDSVIVCSFPFPNKINSLEQLVKLYDDAVYQVT